MSKKVKNTTASSSAGKSTSSTESLPDEAILLKIDLRNSKSVLDYFPLKEGYGQEKQVPLHIRAFDTDYKKTFWMMRQFQSMSTEEQELEKKWENSKRLTKLERIHYNSRIDAIHGERDTIRQEMDRFVSPEPTRPNNDAVSTN